MFEVPDWGDTPNNNLSFTKVLPQKKNKHKKKKIIQPEMPKQIVQAKPKFKVKNTNNKLSKGIQHLKKTDNLLKFKTTNVNIQMKKKTHCQSKINGSTDLKVEKLQFDDNKIKNFNNGKIDKKFNDVTTNVDTNKHDDIKEISCMSPQKVIKNKKIKNGFKKNISNTQTTSTTTEPGEPKQKLSSSKNINEQQIISQPNVTKPQNDTGIAVESKTINKNVNLKNQRKKKLILSVLQMNENSRNHINVSGNKLRERMLDRLKAAKFRYLNEKLYTSTGAEAQQLFQADPEAFQTYHEGYQQQVQKWPVKPLDVIVKRIQQMPKTHAIADMGCGSAALARRVPHAVHSFDLVAAPGVHACDMARTPLAPRAVHAAVYCLALMGTELTRCLLEANRVLKPGGHLLIAEVESRFDDVDAFVSDVQRLGFSLKKLDDTHKVFLFLEFTKVRDPPVKKGKLPTLTLKPCIYKKR